MRNADDHEESPEFNFSASFLSPIRTFKNE